MITVVSFGMGAPIATIVLHELSQLGVTCFLRIGTAMYFPPIQAGDFIVSSKALSFEGTSIAYGDISQPHEASAPLIANVISAADTAGKTASCGLYASSMPSTVICLA